MSDTTNITSTETCFVDTGEGYDFEAETVKRVKSQYMVKLGRDFGDRWFRVRYTNPLNPLSSYVRISKSIDFPVIIFHS